MKKLGPVEERVIGGTRCLCARNQIGRAKLLCYLRGEGDVRWWLDTNLPLSIGYSQAEARLERFLRGARLE